MPLRSFYSRARASSSPMLSCLDESVSEIETAGIVVSIGCLILLA